MGGYTWHPTDAYIDNANVTRLARRYGVGSINALRQKSVADIGWYWDAVVSDLGIPFTRPYSQVVDLSNGIEYPNWFIDGQINIVDACLNRWLSDDDAADRVAIIHESEDGAVRTVTYRELTTQVEQIAGGLRKLGIRKGEVVALLMPMIPEAVIACYAVAQIGAILSPLFSGFAPSAIAARIQDAEAKAVIVADGTVRRGRLIHLKALLDKALGSCPTVEHVIVVGNLSDLPILSAATESRWSDLLKRHSESVGVEPMSPGDPLLLAYTSGTTGRPKGAVQTHAGFLVKTASEAAYSFDISPGSVFCWVTDLGWIMGPLSIIGTHGNGATVVLYEGSPDVPDPSRLWRLVVDHKVSMLGVSPSLIRSLRSGDLTRASHFDLSSVHVLGSTGEPWDDVSYEWLARDLFDSRVPVINFSGGTEVGGSFLAPYPIEPIPSCSLGGPSLGMDVDVVDEHGRSLRGKVGELICRQPWPSMTRGVWRDNERYLEAYWSTFPGVWRHGDFALVDDDGHWFILGRSDDVMNIAGKRLAPAEVEAIMAKHPVVGEAAAVGVPDSTKGETVWAFWVPVAGAPEDVSSELKDLVAAELGKPFAPSLVRKVPQLPKTRSAKIMRRAIRAAALGYDPGDLSGAENPEAVDEIRKIMQSGNDAPK